MKKFLILTALLILTIGPTGCRNNRCFSLLPWNRAVECDPCAIECDPCMTDSCCPDAGYIQQGMPIITQPMMQPAPTAIIPGPQP